MANVVITSTANSIKVDLGVYSSALGYDKVTIRKDKLIDIKLKNGDTFVEAVVLQDGKWTVSYNTVANALVVDTIDTEAPTDNSDLYDKLIALIA
jgi:hypothetical protein